MLTSKHYNEISRDLKRSAEENRSIYLQKVDEIEYKESIRIAYKVFMWGIIGVVVSAWVTTLF